MVVLIMSHTINIDDNLIISLIKIILCNLVLSFFFLFRSFVESEWKCIPFPNTIKTCLFTV